MKLSVHDLLNISLLGIKLTLQHAHSLLMSFAHHPGSSVPDALEPDPSLACKRLRLGVFVHELCLVHL
eukprot:2399509-Amphidinium_carterae.1